jgi:streptomycin 6-kinase
MKKLHRIIVLLLSYCLTINAMQDAIILDTTIAFLSEKWGLSSLQPLTYSALFNNYIAKAYSSVYQNQVILKISESNEERYGLQCLQGDGIVKLLDYDDQYYALLLEYIPSNQSLIDYITTHDDDEIIDIFIDLFKKIHATPRIATAETMHIIPDNFAIFSAYAYKKIPEYFVQKAIEIYEQSKILNDQKYLLHGDLHFRNILKYDDNFIAIDPWITIGPLEYEAASFLTSPTDFLLLQDCTQTTLQNRLNRLSDLLHLDQQKLKNCALLRLIFLACMCEVKHKNDDWIEQFIQVAEIIDQLQT